MTPIVSLALATLAFVGTHLLMSHPLRAALVARLGERGFLGIYTLISFATLGWMTFAWRAVVDSSPLWVAPLWWWPIASALMLVASIFLIGSLIATRLSRVPARAAPKSRRRAGCSRSPAIR